MADHLMRNHIDHADIVLKITGKFGISKHTAETDISYAQEVFSRSRRINKQYMMHLQLQRIDKFISHMEKQFYSVDEKRPVNEKMVQAMAKLYETYTYTINSLPDSQAAVPLPPPIFNFMLPPGVQLPGMSFTDALQAADLLITDIEHESI